MLANGVRDITLTLLTWTIWRAPTNVSKWRMGFNSAFKGLNIEVRIRLYQVRNSKGVRVGVSMVVPIVIMVFSVCDI